MRLAFERTLGCPPEVAFGLLTDPEAMNRWSTARIRSTSLGEGAHPAGTGALRTVTLPGRWGGKLEEVVVESTPAERFAYRVIRGAPVESHQGRIELEPTAEGTAIRWTVDIELPRTVPAFAVRRVLETELDRSLDALVRIAPGATVGPLPPLRRVDDTDVLGGIEAAAEAVARTQRERADALEAAGDPQSWFSRVYQYVTEAMVARAREGRFRHPGWVLRLIPPFEDYYARALDDRVHAESHWAHAFRATARPERWSRGPWLGVSHAVFQGMRAHIEDDLPRTLASVYVAHYADRCEPVRFRGDYLAMGDVFREAGDRLLSQLRRRDKPLRLHLVDTFLSQRAKDRWMARNFYDIDGERRKAFERGRRLAELLGSVRAEPT